MQTNEKNMTKFIYFRTKLLLTNIVLLTNMYSVLGGTDWPVFFENLGILFLYYIDIRYITNSYSYLYTYIILHQQLLILIVENITCMLIYARSRDIYIVIV